MAIDTREKRQAAAWILTGLGCASVTPNASPDVEWRQQVGWSYSGIVPQAEVPQYLAYPYFNELLGNNMSGLFRNVASQKWRVFAYDRTDGTVEESDAAQITAKIAKDWAAAAALTDVNPTETEKGYYLFDLTQAETDADVLDLYPESSTSDIQVIGIPGTIFTERSERGVITGSCSGTPTTTAVTTTDLTNTTADSYKDGWLVMLGGNADGERKQITASVYSGGTTTLTVTPLATAPASGDPFIIT